LPWIICAAILLAGSLLIGCSKPKDPKQVEFDKEFERDAVFLKMCGFDPAVAGGNALKVYRFRNELWFDDRGVLRRVDAKPENVCDTFFPPEKQRTER
jgi:hypothetical protein